MASGFSDVIEHDYGAEPSSTRRVRPNRFALFGTPAESPLESTPLNSRETRLEYHPSRAQAEPAEATFARVQFHLDQIAFCGLTLCSPECEQGWGGWLPQTEHRLKPR
jgi:hypothetical protein